MTRAEASKIVGWNMPPGGIDYPALDEAKAAVLRGDVVSILRWHRFLKSPACTYQGMVMSVIAGGLSLFTEA